MTKIYPEETFPSLKMVVFKKNLILLRGHSLKSFENLDNRGINILAKILAKNSPPLSLHSSMLCLCLCLLFSATRSIKTLSEWGKGVTNIVN